MNDPGNAIDAAARALAAGELVAFPTETVYGLGADAEGPSAVRRIFEVKGRPTSHPLIVHVDSVDWLESLAHDVPSIAFRLAERFWPGPLTLILKRSERVPLAVTGGQATVGIRVPSHPVALALLRRFGRGVAAPSANRFGKLSPTTAAHVREDLGDLVAQVLDGGPCDVGVDSTILDLSREAPRLLRPGGVPREALEEVLGKPLLHETIGPVRAPGLLPSHYAPRAEVVLCSQSELPQRAEALRARGARLGALAPEGTPIALVDVAVTLPGDAVSFARRLYASLRELDAARVDVILVVAPQVRGLGLAVLDRLTRAAAPR
ncbi:MAG TPA: L-threonylcarbamoyladenylate synthase [Polyangiaceae bacterium]|nr:L-threonylcarbamoyladenylate synthase [Polyangiaceae bacterium]